VAEKKNPVPELDRFEGRDVLDATIQVTKAGDGLSKDLSVRPQQFKQHETVYVVLETRVSKVTYADHPDNENASRRVHTLVTANASIVDGQAVASMLAETKRLLAKKAEADRAAKGIITLPETSVTEEGGGKRPDDWDEADGKSE
jgi:hypothetical protein